MKAFILAAGLGTRLSPLTDHTPKALVEIAGKPMLAWVILKLIKAGFREIVINIHHFPEQILEFLDKEKNFGIDIAISDEREELLDSGGAILKAAPLLDDGQAFLLHNVDIVSNPDLGALARYHQDQGALATLTVRQRDTSRYLLMDDSLRLYGWENRITGDYSGLSSGPQKTLMPWAFSGISVISPSLFPLITEKGRFPLTELLLRLAPDHKIMGFPHRDGFWFDLGKAQALTIAAPYIDKL